MFKIICSRHSCNLKTTGLWRPSFLKNVLLKLGVSIVMEEMYCAQLRVMGIGRFCRSIQQATGCRQVGGYLCATVYMVIGGRGKEKSLKGAQNEEIDQKNAQGQ